MPAVGSVKLSHNFQGKPSVLSIGDSKIVLKRHSNITKVAADFIVNAANEGLRNGHGINGAIHKAGGPAILQGCKKFPKRHGDRCPPGETRMTTAGQLPAKVICHTVGPRYTKLPPAKAEKLLKNAYHNTLHVAGRYLQSLVNKKKAYFPQDLSISAKAGLLNKMTRSQPLSIAIPTISTGIFKFPPDKAAKIAIREIVTYAREHQGKKGIKEFNIIFVNGQKDLPYYEKELQKQYHKLK